MTLSMIEFQIQLLILMSVGYLIRKIGLVSNETRSGMSSVLLYVILPANIVNAFMQDISFSSELLTNSLYAMAVSAFVQFGTYFLGMFLYRNAEPNKNPVLRYGILSTNAAFIGIPTLENLYGPMGTLYGAIFMIPYRLTIWTIGIGLFRKSEKKDVLKQLLHPCMIAVLIGFIIMGFGLTLPDVIAKPVQMMSRCTTPLSMLVIGGILAGVDLRTVFSKETLTFSFIRLLALPGILVLLLHFIPADPMIKGIAIVMTGMPAASMSAILAEQYGGDYEFGAKIVMASTVLSMITVPLLGFFIK